MSLKSSPYSPLPPVRRPTPTSVRPPFVPPFIKNQGRSNSTTTKGNSANKNPFDKPSLLIRKKTNSFILHTLNPSNATLSTIHDSNATLPALSKTSLHQVRGSDPRAQAFRSKGRSNTTNILDTSSGGVTLNSYTHSHSSAKLTRGNSLEIEQQNLSRNCDTITETSQMDISSVIVPEKRAQAPRKAIQLIPLNLNQITGKYEKPPQSVERDLKSYVKKVHAIDQLDSRRLKKRGTSEGRNEGAIACRESLSKIPGLKPEEKQRLMSVSIDDENYFQKIESAINDTSKRIDRDQRLTQILELVNGEWLKMDVQRNVSRYCYVAVKGMLAPLEVLIKTPKESKSLKVYVSRSQKKPSKKHHDLEFDNKNFRIYDKDRTLKIFSTGYLYFAFSIDVSELISVKVNFAEPEGSKRPIDNIRYTPHQSKWKPRFLTEENEDYDFNKDMDRFNDYLKVKHSKDIIGLNRSNLDRFSIEARKQNLEAKKHKLESMVKKTLETKQEILQTKRKQSYLKLISKDVQKGLKDIMYENHEKRVKAELMGQRWLTGIAMMNMAKHMYECLQRGREKERIRLQRVMAATMIAIKYRSSQKFRGPDVNYRTTLDIRSALSMTASLIQESDSYKTGKIEEQEKSEQLMITFLQDSREVHYLRNRINIVIQRITAIQTVWKKFLKKKENFMEILRRLWIRNSVFLFETIIIPKMKKDYERKEKINQIKAFDIKNNEKAQEKFVNGYYSTCLANYVKKYAVYRDKLRGVDRTHQIILNFFDLLKRGMEEDEDHEEEEKPDAKLVTQKTITILEEIENNKIETDSNIGEPTITPPRLFILPNWKDVEEFLAQCIENQIIESIFPRKNDRLLKALSSFNKKIAKN